MAYGDDKIAGYTLRWRRRWLKGYHQDLLMWVLMDYFIDHANWKPTEKYIKGHGLVKLRRGEHLYGTKNLAVFFGVTRQKIRSAINRLEEIDFLTTRTTNRFSIATVVKYDTYQDKPLKVNQQIDQQIPNRYPTDNQQITTPKELNTLKALKEIEISPLEIINRAIEYLNMLTGSSFKPDNYVTQTIILDRINDGASLEDLKAVCKKKTSQWINDEKMAGNLRPVTLFAADKFEGYLQEAKRNGNSKSESKRKLSAIELMALGYDILCNFGDEKFDEWCHHNNIGNNDTAAIRDRYNREIKQKNNDF